MYKLSYGLFVLTAREDGKDNGCIINTAIQAASEPNQLSICVNKANYTHDMIQRTGKFTVSRHHDTSDDIIKRADSLMYQSKNNGRNMVSTDVSAENA